MVNKVIVVWRPPKVKGHQIVWLSDVNDVISLCSRFGYDMLKSCWEQAYFLLGGFAVKFDWLSRPNGFEFEKAV